MVSYTLISSLSGNGLSRHKKAQLITIDFMIALFIFSLVLILFLRYYSMNIQDNISFQELEIDAKSISGSLLTVGYPSNWTPSDVKIIGIVDADGRIDNSKLDKFVNISYQQARSSFRTDFDFYFFLQDADNNTFYPYGSFPVNEKQLVKNIHYVIWNSRVMNMVVYVWD